MRHKYRHFLWRGWSDEAWTLPGSQETFTPDDRCAREHCALSLAVDNNFLARLHLVDRAAFMARVVVLQNRAVWVEVMFLGGPVGSTGAIVEYSDCCRSYSTAGSYDFPRSLGEPVLSVSLSNNATAEQKRHAFAADMTCLTHRGDCELPCRYLPLAWKDFVARWRPGDREIAGSFGKMCE